MALAVRCVHVLDKSKTYHRCVAAVEKNGKRACTYVRKGAPKSGRILRHARHCCDLSAELRKKANDWSASESLGAKVGALPQPDVVMAVSGKDAPAASSPSQSSATSSTSVTKSPLLQLSVASGRKDVHDKVNHKILKLICVRGLVPSVVDASEFHDFTSSLNPRYTPPASTTFTTTLTPAEAAHVRKLQIDALQKERNLTLSYDGRTTRKPQSVYTVHITTQDRRVYFIDGNEALHESHTAEH